MHRFVILFACIFCIACEDDSELPSGLYHYQVERLLSGGETKQWVLNSTLLDGKSGDLGECPNELIFLEEQDSVQVLQLIPKCSVSGYDTLDLGLANASTDDLLFTDSLIFKDGSFWLLKKIYAESFVLKYTVGSTQITEKYSAQQE